MSGQLALAYHGYIRATQHVDLAEQLSRRALEAVTSALAERGHSVRMEVPDSADVASVLIVTGVDFEPVRVVCFDARLQRLLDEAQSRAARLIHAAQLKVVDVETLILLLLLRDGSTHGYDLAETLGDVVPGERIDLGNLYRLLRSLEEEGIVTSTWRDDLPGRSKRTYDLTPEGERLLDTWAEALRTAQNQIAAFLQRYDERSSA